jgi:hypothetical protein
MSAASPEPARRGPASLRDSLELVLPALPAELVSAEAIPWLRAVASVLPPVHRAGFECRLADTEDEVDLQQGIFASDAEPARLARFLAEAGPANDAWAGVHRVAERWSAPDDPLHGAIDELWLELDAAPGGGHAALALSDARPSVFAVLERADVDSLPIARSLVQMLVNGEESAALDRALTRCSHACPESARVSHVGVMLGRSLPAMRVHIRGVPLRELTGYLARVDWGGEPGEIASLAQALLDYGDWVVVCLDILVDQIVRVGVECFFAEKRGLDPRWRPLLERLIDLGLSSAAKADALLRWPATFTPLDSPGRWPENLIAQSLTEPEDTLGAFDRRLSHVKLTFVPEQPVTAKAYFGYGHVWMRAHPATEAMTAPTRRAATTVDDAAEAAVDWLLAARHQSGWWRDFAATPAVGFSDEWVTGYVGDALARVALPRARDAAMDALELLLTRRLGGDGWGFNVQLPVDGDATTWALRLAQSLGSPELERFAAARRALSELTTPDGGVTSYPASAAPEVDRTVLVGGSYDGWTNAHLCITAPAARLGLDASTATYLRASQNRDGSWSSYWWPDDEYATAWAVEALARSAEDDPAVAAAVAWCVGRIADDGAVRSAADGPPAAFPTALALYAMRIGGSRARHDGWVAAAERAERWLLEHQLQDGSWGPSARMRVPAPSVHDPSASPEEILRDVGDSGVWTTATVVVALSAAQSSRR